jgi:hypothetical protein
VGGDDGPGEVAVLRLRGELAGHANSVAIPQDVNFLKYATVGRQNGHIQRLPPW